MARGFVQKAGEEPPLRLLRLAVPLALYDAPLEPRRLAPRRVLDLQVAGLSERGHVPRVEAYDVLECLRGPRQVPGFGGAPGERAQYADGGRVREIAVLKDLYGLLGPVLPHVGLGEAYDDAGVVGLGHVGLLHQFPRRSRIALHEELHALPVVLVGLGEELLLLPLPHLLYGPPRVGPYRGP